VATTLGTRFAGRQKPRKTTKKLNGTVPPKKKGKYDGPRLGLERGERGKTCGGWGTLQTTRSAMWRVGGKKTEKGVPSKKKKKGGHREIKIKCKTGLNGKPGFNLLESPGAPWWVNNNGSGDGKETALQGHKKL